MTDEDELDLGEAGSSARRKERQLAQRRREREAQRTRSQRLLISLFGPSGEDRRAAADQKAWNTGAEGEETLERYLAQHCPDVVLLKDRRRPRTTANIDFLAVAATGVHIIDAKRVRGTIEIRSPLFGTPTLRIAGRDRTDYVESLRKQAEAVTAALAPTDPDVPVLACWCFLAPKGHLSDSGLPLARTLTINGYRLYHPRRLAKKLNRPGPITPARAQHLARALAQHFPTA
jgi:hypothetical protein